MTDLEKRYAEWRKSRNGIEVYGKALTMAHRLIQKGHIRYSIRTIIHAMRYHEDIRWRDKDGYKINNVYTPYLARELIATGLLPDRFFETREVKHDPTDDQQTLVLT